MRRLPRPARPAARPVLHDCGAPKAKINAILQRDETLLRRDVREDRRKERLKAVHDAITKRKEARQFVIQEKERVRRLLTMPFKSARVLLCSTSICWASVFLLIVAARCCHDRERYAGGYIRAREI